MLIKNVKISNYKNLNVDWNLSKAGNVVAILGKNASGKTNLFETLLGLSNVADDSEQISASFNGEIEFNIDGRTLWLNENGAFQKKSIKIKQRKGLDKTNSETEVPDIVRISLPDDFCPRRFISPRKYNRFTSKDHKFSFYNELKYGDDFHNFILYIFSISEEFAIRKLIKEVLGIEHILPFRFYADVNQIEKLQEPTKTYMRIVKSFVNTQNCIDINNYEFDEEKLIKLAEEYGNENDFFDALHYLSQAGVLKIGVYDSLSVEKKGKKISVESLSDGEKQLLYIMAVIRYYMGRNVVLLFDEPDTHIYPNMQMNLIEYIKKLDDKMNIIIATHSPYIVSSLEKENVFYMDDGEIFPVGNTKGKDINSIMSNIFNTPIRPMGTQKNIADIYDIIEKEKISDVEINNAKQMIDMIAKDLGEDDAEIITMRALLNSRDKK